MQSKGAIRFVAILLALVCLWELSFSVVSRVQEKKSVKYGEKVAAAILESAAYKNVAEGDKAYCLDSLEKVYSRKYIDSISTEKVYMGYTFKQVREKDVNLGLDLKGGMNVMLQVQLQDLVKALADNNPSPEFNKAIAIATDRSVKERADFITLFAETWKEIGNCPLSQIFGTFEMRDKIKPDFTDAQVIEVIRAESESAISNSFNVLRNRIDRFGVTQPNIQKIGNSGRILVELPGVKEPERVRKLLQGTASLEFWATYQNTEIYPFLEEANQIVAQLISEGEASAIVSQPQEKESSEEDILAQEENAAASEDDAAAEEFRKANPLFAVLNPPMYNGRLSGTACIGYANYTDTVAVNRYLNLPAVKALFPAEFTPMWSVKPVEGTENIYELIAIKASSRDGKAPLDGGVVTDARVQYSNMRGGTPAVSMTMNAEGANTWAQLTKQNIGKQVAIVLDGMVYSYPTVNTEITGGSSEITGNFDLEEAEDLANVLKSGKLPAPATIIQEQVVGPSLGTESINAGLISFAIAFLLVLIYMAVYYNQAGRVADVALLCNVLLLMGALVSFGAVLTLPGIAGLVLTLGMAVDANVIIYERIKEELRAGKGLSIAIRDGYSNAYSAIIDGQVTTLLTGLVLFFIGTGPVKGFATTLIVGIVTSVLTAIFISRLIFEDKVAAGKSISFDNKFTREFLQHTHVHFLEHRKVYYIISGCIIAIGIVSICVKGFTYGVDFTGGRTYVVRFDQGVQTEAVRQSTLDVFNAAADADPSVKNASVEVKQFGGESQIKVTTSYKFDQESLEVDEEVEQLLYQSLKDFFATELTFNEFRSTLENPNGIISSDKVGATIANDMKRKAVYSVILALLVIFGYIAVRFKKWTWGLSGVISLGHTAFIVIGFFSLFSGILPFSLDVDSTFIAAILTIIGYAINDNVVIFDRIREYRTLHPKDDLMSTTNNALNATLSRTLNTSLTTLITMLAIGIFGGEVIRGLAVALILGIMIGTYASICIGSPIMYDLEMARMKKLEKKSSK